MQPKEIIAFVKANIEPLPAQGPCGERYRVSATLTDGTFLPCVVVEGLASRVDFAIKRFRDSAGSDDRFMGYRHIVELFVARNNSVNDYDIKTLGESQFAIPLARLSEIGGETSMSWTAFHATMTDGAEFDFGTTFLTEFFDMPSGYSAKDIVKIVPAKRGIPSRYKFFRERPFFTCYVEGL